MYSLLIDTHSNILNIILYKDKKFYASISRETPSQSKLLVPLIQNIMDEQNIQINEMSEVIVVNGPGSFTGVRLGVTVAKTISYCLNIDIKSISSLDLLALSIEKETNYSVAIKDPKGYYIGEYSKDGILQNEYFYLNKDEFLTYETKNEVIQDTQISWNNVYKCNLLKIEDYYNIKPLYIKKIEVEK
ncbi:MAG: tRNA (adenosine(37)-N6)-threonylcarbamoyltransferase complex dimerization subunit type 1 TsaB [Bacilli bacterium]|nr:tRNA (adenosine(37)-N6)-threonylcarbamoyltransferase complex dimerization subunit type 1 TsaB [Bacilli bacterium]